MVEPNFKVGDRIIVTSQEINGHMGTIKYIGPMAGSKGTWFGIELDNAVGKSDGTSTGKKYFECKPKHAVFLQEGAFIPLEFDFNQAEGNEEGEEDSTMVSGDVTHDDGDSGHDGATDSVQTSSLTDVTEKIEKPAEKATTKVEKKPGKDVPAKPGVTKTPATKVPAKADPKAAAGATTVKKTGKVVAAPTTTTKPAGTKPAGTTTAPAKDEKVAGGAGTKNAPHNNTSKIVVPDEDLQKEIELLDSEVKILTEELEVREKQIAELNARNAELSAKMEDKEASFRKEKEDLQKKISELQAAKVDELKRLEDQDSEYKKKFKDTHHQLTEVIKEKKEAEFQVNKMQREIEKLQKEIESHQNSEAMFEDLIIEKDALAERVELAEAELEEAKQRIKALEEEKELQQLEAEEELLAQGNSDIGELKLENMKLKQALEKLYLKYDVERKEAEAKIKSLSEKVETLPRIEEKDKLVKQLNEEIKKKDEIIDDLKYRVDDAAESVEMVETLTDELLKKDDEIIELRREIMHLKKDLETDEQLVDEQEEYMKVLEKDVIARDVEITNLKAKIQDQINTQQETEKLMQKYKEKIRNLNEEMSLLKQKVAGGDEKRLFDKIDELSHKQIELINQIRENHKRELIAQLEKIKANTETLKYTVLISVLPKNLQDKMYIDSLSKYIQIIVLKDKINLLAREIKSRYMKDEYHANENIDFIVWLKGLLFDLADIIFYCDILELRFYSFDNPEGVENYILFSKSNVFNQLLAINSIVEQLFAHIKEDTLSVKFNLETLRLVVSKLVTSAKELEEQFAILPIKLKKLIDQATAQTYELYALGINKQKKFKKMEKIIARFEELNAKFHKSLLLQDDNVDDKHESNLEIMINLKYSLESFCDKMRQTPLPEDTELESIEANFDHECSRLTNYQPVNEDEYVAVTLRGPWNQINNSLRNEIEQVSETAISFEKANSQLKEQIRANLQQQNEIKDLNNIKATLEKRVADLQIKAEKVAMLEMEKKRFMEREVHFKEATEKIRQTLENAEKRVRSLEEENAKLKQSAGSSSSQDRSGGRSTAGVKKPIASLLGKEMSVGGVAQTEVEEYLNIIYKLSDENLSAKGGELKRRMRNLDESMPEFVKCMERLNPSSENDGGKIRLSDEEQSKLNGIVNRVSEVGKRTKLEICQSAVISLDEFSKKSKYEKSDFVNNYMKNKNETHSKLRYEVMSLSNTIVNFANKVEEQSRFKLFFEPTVVNLIQNRNGPGKTLGSLEIHSNQGSSNSDRNSIGEKR